MESRHWAYPYDERGVRREFSVIPETVAGLRDDPYRSLAAYVHDGCGFSKVEAPFAEFRWAEYFRKRGMIQPGQAIGPAIIKRAIADSRLDAAADLPGFCGNRCSCR